MPKCPFLLVEIIVIPVSATVNEYGVRDVFYAAFNAVIRAFPDDRATRCDAGAGSNKDKWSVGSADLEAQLA